MRSANGGKGRRPGFRWGLLILIGLALACSPDVGEGSADPPSQEVEVLAADSLEGEFLYQLVLLRAAPGRILDLVELLKEERDLFADVNEPEPFWMRHTQGDQWDLLILYPVGTMHDYFEPGRVERRLESGRQKGLSERQLRLEADRITSWRDELFVRGPDPSLLEPFFSDHDFYHVEMFVALPGRRRELLQERRMENEYLRLLNRPRNLIFTRESGGPWDAFTLGFYRDLPHFAESAGIPADAREAAAQAAGFDGANEIGSYLRRLILYHRDTLCVSIQ